jgi:hypothetical protein
MFVHNPLLAGAAGLMGRLLDLVDFQTHPFSGGDQRWNPFGALEHHPNICNIRFLASYRFVPYLYQGLSRYCDHENNNGHLEVLKRKELSHRAG